jgi:DNA-binding response OmpR family regulator
MKAIAIVAQEEEIFEFLGYLLTKEGYEARLFRDPAVLSS